MFLRRWKVKWVWPLGWSWRPFLMGDSCGGTSWKGKQMPSTHDVLSRFLMTHKGGQLFQRILTVVYDKLTSFFCSIQCHVGQSFNMHDWFFLNRHNTMAIGVAVDILGCTGSLEERAATLNRIILVALELKDSMGDLYAFSSIMKALDMPQVPNSSF